MCGSYQREHISANISLSLYVSCRTLINWQMILPAIHFFIDTFRIYFPFFGASAAPAVNSAPPTPHRVVQFMCCQPTTIPSWVYGLLVSDLMHFWNASSDSRSQAANLQGKCTNNIAEMDFRDTVASAKAPDKGCPVWIACRNCCRAAGVFTDTPYFLYVSLRYAHLIAAALPCVLQLAYLYSRLDVATIRAGNGRYIYVYIQVAEALKLIK